MRAKLVAALIYDRIKFDVWRQTLIKTIHIQRTYKCIKVQFTLSKIWSYAIELLHEAD